jgi:hypothetical protein
LVRYTIEGHVPVAAIKKLLASKADVVGLSARHAIEQPRYG